MPLDGFVVTLPRLPANPQTALFAKCRHYLIGISAHSSFLMGRRRIQPAQCWSSSRMFRPHRLQPPSDSCRTAPAPGVWRRILESCWTTWRKTQELRRRKETAEEWQIQGQNQNNITLLWWLNSLDLLMYLPQRQRSSFEEQPCHNQRIVNTPALICKRAQKCQSLEWVTRSRVHTAGCLPRELRGGNSYVKVAAQSFTIAPYISRNGSHSLFHIYHLTCQSSGRLLLLTVLNCCFSK